MKKIILTIVALLMAQSSYPSEPVFNYVADTTEGTMASNAVMALRFIQEENHFELQQLKERIQRAHLDYPNEDENILAAIKRAFKQLPRDDFQPEPRTLKPYVKLYHWDKSIFGSYGEEFFRNLPQAIQELLETYKYYDYASFNNRLIDAERDLKLFSNQ